MNGIIVLLKTPPKYRKLDETKNKNAPKITRLLAIFAEHGIMAHIPLANENFRIALSNDTVFNNFYYLLCCTYIAVVERYTSLMRFKPLDSAVYKSMTLFVLILLIINARLHYKEKRMETHHKKSQEKVLQRRKVQSRSLLQDQSHQLLMVPTGM